MQNFFYIIEVYLKHYVCKVFNFTFWVTTEYKHLGIARNSATPIPIFWHTISYIAHGYIYIYIYAWGERVLRL